MPAQIILVNDDQDFARQASAALQDVGYSVAFFIDPDGAWDAIRGLSVARLLITKILFAPGKLNGIALAHSAHRRKAPLKVLFTDSPELIEHVADNGAFLPLPVSISDLLQSVKSIIPLDER